MSPSQTIPVSTTLPQGFVTYEQLLNQDLEWALIEGSLFFEGRGRVQETLKRITARLEQLGIPYAVAGGVALFLHGYRRFTEDVDLLVTSEGLERVHQELDGLGYLRPFEKSKNLRDAESKVKIEFLIAGQYPGDGLPKNISFPDPAAVAEVRDGIQVLRLPELITLKLASGMTGKGRGKDLIDVGELIKTLRLPRSLEHQLHCDVRNKYLELWRENYSTAENFLRYWRISATSAVIRSIADLMACELNATEDLAAMRAAGVSIDPRSKPDQGFVYLAVNDPDVAQRFDMHDESEFMDLNAAGLPADQ